MFRAFSPITTTLMSYYVMPMLISFHYQISSPLRFDTLLPPMAVDADFAAGYDFLCLFRFDVIYACFRRLFSLYAALPAAA